VCCGEPKPKFTMESTTLFSIQMCGKSNKK
jgi:hypothetical protein